MARSSNDSQLPDDVATAREPASRLKAAGVRFQAKYQCQRLAQRDLDPLPRALSVRLSGASVEGTGASLARTSRLAADAGFWRFGPACSRPAGNYPTCQGASSTIGPLGQGALLLTETEATQAVL